MNCLEFRRLVLTAPRQITAGRQAHLERCARCAGFAQSVAHDEAAIEQALLVSVPEGLAARVLLRHKIRGPNRWSTLALAASLPLALAASLIVAVGVAFHVNEVVPGQGDEIMSAQRPGANQHAVAAISYVLDHEPQLLKENRAGDPKIMRAALSKLGLSLPADIGNVRYLGKSVLPDGTTGEHIVLQTPYGRVTLFLMPEVFLASRVAVSDRNRQALVAPRRQGCYLLVADSAQTLERVEAML